MVSYCVACLYCASIPGNKFYNGILFGLGEFLGTFFSQVLLGILDDMKSFYFVASLGLISYFTFIFFPFIGIHTYMATFFAITSIGAWFNVMLLILEMRVPPNKIGFTSMITRTVAVGSSVFAPTIVTFPPPYPFLVLSAIYTLGIISTFFLPPAGIYLPKTKQTGEHSVQLVDRSTDQISVIHLASQGANVSYATHSMSYNETYTEKRLKVQRVQMNESRLDP